MSFVPKKNLSLVAAGIPAAGIFLLIFLMIRPAMAENVDLCQPGYPGNGSVWLAQGYLVPKGIASVNLDTGSVNLITQSPLVLRSDGSPDEINSIASDPVNTLVYYSRNSRSHANRSLYAYNWVTDTHILIAADVLAIIGYPFANPAFGYDTTLNDQAPWGIGSAAASLLRTADGTQLYLGIERAMNPHLQFQTQKTSRTMIMQFDLAADGKSLTGGRIIADLGDYNPPPGRSDPRDYGDILMTEDQGLFAIVGNHFLFPDTLTAVPAAHVPTPYHPGVVTDLHFNAVGADAGEYFYGAYGQAAKSWNGKYWLLDALVDFGDPDVFSDNIYHSFLQNWDIKGLKDSTFRDLKLSDGTLFPGLSINDAGGCVPATAELGVLVWNDYDLDGVFDAGEFGVPGLTAELYADVNNNGIVDEGDILLTSTTTDSNGLYLFDQLPPGNYAVAVTTDALISTTGAVLTGVSHTLNSNLDIGESDFTVNFGLANIVVTGVRTPGYWKNHQNEWPVDQVVIGDRVYTLSQAISIMKTATKKSMWSLMFMHVVAADLNLLAGVSDDCGGDVDEINRLLVDGYHWLEIYQDQQPVRAKQDVWTDEAEFIKNRLDLFNNGQLSLTCAPAKD